MGKKGLRSAWPRKKLFTNFLSTTLKKFQELLNTFVIILNYLILLCCRPPELLQTHFAGNLLQELQQ